MMFKAKGARCPACGGSGIMHPRRFQVPCGVCDGSGVMQKSFRYSPPQNAAWSFLKEADLTPAQWKPDAQQNGGQQGTVGEAPKKSPEEEMREKESDHNISVNNPATQEWFTSLLPDTVEFRQKLLSAMWNPGTALHSPNYKKDVKPMERSAKELDSLIAHMRSMHGDTPGAGRGTMPNGSSKGPKNASAAKFEREFSGPGGE